MTKIPVFDIGDTLLPSEKLINKTVKRKLHQQGIRDVPDFPINEYNIYKPEDVQEWLDEHGIETDAEKVSLAYKGSARRYLDRKKVIEILQELGEEHGPIGFITDNSVEAKEFFKTLFDPDEEDEDDEFEGINYEGFIVSEEVGVQKPDEEIFKAFLDERDEPAEDFVYIGNRPETDSACEEVGITFVWLDRHENFGSEWDGKKIYKLSVENVEKVLEELEEE